MEGKPGRSENFQRDSIRGKVLIPANVLTFENATAHVRLEEISAEDDKGADVRAEVTIPLISHQRGAETLVDFAINVGEDSFEVNPKNDYAVRVWIDYNSDGQRGPGDCYSDERHSVLMDGPAGPLLIKVVQR